MRTSIRTASPRSHRARASSSGHLRRARAGAGRPGDARDARERGREDEGGTAAGRTHGRHRSTRQGQALGWVTKPCSPESRSPAAGGCCRPAICSPRRRACSTSSGSASSSPSPASASRSSGRPSRRPLIYMDHGASTHPPSPVLETYKDFLEHSYANVHRGRHYLSEMATDRFEHVSDDIFRFITGSRAGNSVILCSNTTQALDLAAHVMARREGVTLVSLMEHHSNDLPHRARGEVVHFGVKDDGTLDYDDLEAQAPRARGEARGGHRRLERHRLPRRHPPRSPAWPTRAARGSSSTARRSWPTRRCDVLPDDGPGPPRLLRRERATRRTRPSARRSCSGRPSSSTRRRPTSPRAARSST